MKFSTIVLLLCCGLSMEQTPTPTSAPTSTPTLNTTLTPQFNQSVLSKLEELKDELRNATTALHHMETRLRVSESQVEGLQKELKDQSQLMKAQAVNRSIIESKLLTQVQELITTQHNSRVAFSAYLNRPDGDNIGPFNRATKLVFEHVITNIGNAYNSHTGAFTAPLRGVYKFDLHIQGLGSSTFVQVDLLKNNEFMAIAFGYQRNYRVSTSNGISLLLKAGDVITLMLPSARSIYGDVYRVTTFSGHLLFPM